MTQRIAILGGTFDPIHVGHLAIAEDIRFALDAAQIIFIPTAQQPFKATFQHTAAEHRLAMVRVATADNPSFAVSDVEVRRGGVSYSVETVAAFHSQFPHDELLFIVGADAAVDLPRWFDVERLLRLCRIVVVQRPGYSFDVEELYTAVPSAAGRIVLVDGPSLTISSSELRARLYEGRPVRYHVSAPVLRYIEEHRLYRRHNADDAT